MVDKKPTSTKNEIIETGMQKVVRGRRKRIKISEAIVDGNTVQMPFLVPYRDHKKTPITSVEFYWTTMENGKQVKRGIEISGHGRLGVPTLKDKAVLMALQNIYIENKIKDGILELEEDENKIKDEDLFIDFQDIKNIAHEMGYKSVSTQQKNSIKECIERLVSTTMINKASGGLYDPETKLYITSTDTFRYLEGMENYAMYDCDNCKKLKECNRNYENCKCEELKRIDVTKIKISRFFYKCIVNNFNMIYEKDLSNQIKNLTARNIYLISLRWLGKDNCTSVANIKKYIERLPMNAKSDKHKKQSIRESIDKLDSYDFVKATLEGDLVKITHLNKIKNNVSVIKKKEETNDTSYLKNKYNTYDEVKNKLIEYGFLEIELSYYLSFEMMQHIRYIQALMRYTEILITYDKVKDPKNFITSGLQYKDGKFAYNIEEKYYTRS